MKNINDIEGMDIDSKLAKILVRLRIVRPFYSAIYESLERVEDKSVETMGVSTTQMVYNPDFVDTLTFEELMFTSLHEVAHVALMHVSRRKNRDPLLWNVACDLYVNKLLAEEFDIKPGETNTENNIKFLKNCLYTDTIDIDTDCAESLYEQLNEQANCNGYNDGDGTYSFSVKGDAPGNPYKFEINKQTYISDIIEDDKESEAEKENNNKRILSEAVTRHEMTNKDIGNQAGKLQFKVAEILKSHLDWRKLLKKYCRIALRKDSSFSRPDKRMFYQKAIYPGQLSESEEELKGVKVCFDSSGSISNKDIAYFYGQVQDILKQYKVEAELIYWDTEIASSGDFMSFNDMQNITAAGRGGTDPSCIFEYFDSKKCKIKPVVTLVFTDGYVPEHLEKSKWARKYKDTIWIMTKDHNKTFKPDFGVVAFAKFSS